MSIALDLLLRVYFPNYDGTTTDIAVMDEPRDQIFKVRLTKTEVEWLTGSDKLRQLQCSEVSQLVQMLTVDAVHFLRPRRPYHQQAKEWLDANPPTFEEMRNAIDKI